ncbi:MAG: DUF4199 domain-containing protein [Bacteroidota bacterium]
MAKSTVKYSIICGVFLFTLFFVSLKFGGNPFFNIRHYFFDIVIFFLFIFFAGKEFKDFKYNGCLHFWQGISIGFIVFIPAAIVFSLLLYITFELNPELMEGYRKAAKAFIESKEDILLEEFSSEKLSEQYSAVDVISTSELALKTFWKKLFMGFFVTPIVSIILRRKPK